VVVWELGGRVDRFGVVRDARFDDPHAAKSNAAPRTTATRVEVVGRFVADRSIRDNARHDGEPVGDDAVGEYRADCGTCLRAGGGESCNQGRFDCAKSTGCGCDGRDGGLAEVNREDDRNAKADVVGEARDSERERVGEGRAGAAE
jgi:hypothetical protein